MKLLNVSIRKLHKYISTELSFDNDLSIITGVNGSGKTQILRLIDAALRLNINYINEIEFELFTLAFEHEQEIYNIEIEKKQKTFNFSINNEVISIPYEDKQNSLFARTKTLKDEFILYYQNSLLQNPSSNFIVFSRIRPPILLGLNRIVENEEETSLFDIEKNNPWLREQNIKDKPVHNDHMFNSISQCKKLIMNESESIKKYEDAQSSVLRNKIITSSFDYLDGNFLSQDDLSAKLQNVYDRKNSIIEELEKLNINDANTNAQIGIFFDKLDRLKFAFDKNKEKEITFELLLNLSQIERVSNIISIIDDNKKTMDIKREKLTSFMDTVNEFFSYTGKKS
ncbi:hypothetical protein AP033_10923 [Vibrio cholerae]|uniref:hypothetical protein n=1 Tax=Vibrio cholerae TaxID=666 RepID=UPI00053C7B72|nr:hypothetical protein [Vibrio cholerae]AOY46138.1 hypothetical protein NH62_10919 [Vibrio cholerae]AOY49746.1 hypothetical protein AP033_10923 [Vibrio cholerae]QHQ92542.1 hypothetical protein FKV26_19060 [Vibrio cholerae O1]HDV5598747.1 hypothetical protein [Vibrio cholerae]